MTPASALDLLRAALDAGAVRVTAHAAEQVEAAGFETPLIGRELERAALRGAVARNSNNPGCALAYGDILTISFGRDGGRKAAVVVTVWVQERT